jgi:hypothetical protein
MMNALAISRARAVIVTTRDYPRQTIDCVLHFHPNLVMTAALSVSSRRVAEMEQRVVV